jgi:SAM-dependent methyltransferase
VEAKVLEVQPGDLFMLQDRERRTARLLGELFPAGLGTLRVLDFGCGVGWDLLELRSLGADRASTVGVDLLAPRLHTARRMLPDAPLLRAHGAQLPFADDYFDLTLAFTVFSSILDGGVRAQVATELQRVARPGGILLWYDLRVDNPRNPDVRSVSRRELRTLFPTWSLRARSVTLAPPLARLLAPVSWLAAGAAAVLPAFRTHLLAALTKP